MKLGQPIQLFLASLTVAALAACGGGGDAPTQTGTLRMAMTDAPSCGYDSVNVTVEKVRVHQSASAADADGGWSEITLSPARRINLLALTNGVLDELGQTALPAGKYTQMRLIL
ncbi:MAG: DUF4382 domain-containing protein, partial [Bdellovibrionales bacterium]|nr:DUF4382 domain-containing protein [Ramlibacter sp.]